MRRRSSSRREVGDDPAVTEEQQPVAAGRLVHHVARDEQRRAAVGELVEEVPEVAPEHRIEADRRLVEHEHVGLVEQRRGERDAGLLPAREAPDELRGRVGEADTLDHGVDPRRRGAPSTRAK